MITVKANYNKLETSKQIMNVIWRLMAIYNAYAYTKELYDIANEKQNEVFKNPEKTNITKAELKDLLIDTDIAIRDFLDN